jgi:hypothetical protein
MQWKACADRSPERNCQVLVFVRSGQDGDIAIGWRDAKGFWETNDSHYIGWEITHWMPLPAPPRKSGAKRGDSSESG